MTREEAVEILDRFLHEHTGDDEAGKLVKAAWWIVRYQPWLLDPDDHQGQDPGRRRLTASEFNQEYRGNPYELD